MRVDATGNSPFPGHGVVTLPMILNPTKEVTEMSIPRFTAEAALYNSVTPYRSSCFSPTEIGLNVTPQLALNWPEVRCRVMCWAAFRADPNHNWDNLEACLNECG